MYVQTKSSVTVNKKVIRYYYLNVITTLGNHSFRTEEKFLLKFNSTLVYSVQNNNTALQMFIQIMNTSCYICSILHTRYTTADFGQDNYILCYVLI